MGGEASMKHRENREGLKCRVEQNTFHQTDPVIEEPRANMNYK
jgi:hypothetical protein